MEKQEFPYDLSYTQNRELSWLRFNERVLAEATDETVPVFERLRFLSIFSNNLDEFFMVRVARLIDFALIKKEHRDCKCALTAQEQLEEIFQFCAFLLRKRDKIFHAVEQDLRDCGCRNLLPKELSPEQYCYVKDYFKNNIAPLLSPQILELSHPFPHLTNKSLVIAVTLADNKKRLYGLIPVPKSVPRVVFLQGDGFGYVLAEHVILEFAEEIFEHYTVLEKSLICVTRSADIHADTEVFEWGEDYLDHMKKLLQKRARLSPVRLEVRGSADSHLFSYLCNRLNLQKDQVFFCNAPPEWSYVNILSEKMPPVLKRQITYEAFDVQSMAPSLNQERVCTRLRHGDILLIHPYDGMDLFLRLLRECAVSEQTISIQITIYRLSQQSRLMDALITAAENGKDVTVLVELRARFDEQNNMDWSRRLKQAGCRVIYGPEGFKVHSKICLITRRERGKIRYITQIGTGNYNEKTATCYTDFSLMTANDEIGADAALFFKNMAIGNVEGPYQLLLVSPRGLERGILELIHEEEEKARKGKPARILAKMNSLSNREMIDALQRASQAGVEIRLLVRGICCLLPGVEGKTGNITVTSVVGRFLEHSRLYCFGTGNEMKMYLSSADMMTRNLRRRVEIACPVTDVTARRKMLAYFYAMMGDNEKARRLNNKGVYESVPSRAGKSLNAQEMLMRKAVSCARNAPKREKRIY